MRTNQLQERNTIGSGNGVLLVGPVGGVNPSTYPDETNLQEVGSLEGDSQINFTREMLDIMDGQPQVLIKKEAIRESARITCVLKENRLGQIAQQIGFEADKATYNAANSTATVTEEIKKLFDTAWARLQGRNISNSPDIQVQSLDATPVTYVQNIDYAVDYVTGAIRRIDGGSIPDGGNVAVSYTWSRPAYRILKFGGDTTVHEVSLVFIYTQPEDRNRVITVFPRAIASEGMQQDYRSGNVNTRNLSFDAVYEPTALPGEGLGWQIHEGEVQTDYYID